MNDTRTDQIKSDWKEAQNDAQLDQSNLIEIVRFLARQAAQRDFEAHKEAKERKDSDDD